MGLTLVMAVFGQPKMLATQFAEIRGYPTDVLDQLTVIIVDDHGNPPVAKREVEALDVGVKDAQLYRIVDDIPWNQMGARNLGMHKAHDWCVMLDPDMVIPASQIRGFLKAAANGRRGVVTRFALKHHNGAIDMSSPNTYLIHRDDFFAVGGYDEDYRGNKGWSDVQLLAIFGAHFKMKRRPDLWVDYYSTDQIEDAMVRSLDRSVGVNKQLHLRKVAQARHSGGWVKWVNKQKRPNLRFRWGQSH